MLRSNNICKQSYILYKSLSQMLTFDIFSSKLTIYLQPIVKIFSTFFIIVFFMVWSNVICKQSYILYKSLNQMLTFVLFSSKLTSYLQPFVNYFSTCYHSIFSVFSSYGQMLLVSSRIPYTRAKCQMTTFVWGNFFL